MEGRLMDHGNKNFNISACQEHHTKQPILSLQTMALSTLMMRLRRKMWTSRTSITTLKVICRLSMFSRWAAHPLKSQWQIQQRR